MYASVKGGWKNKRGTTVFCCYFGCLNAGKILNLSLPLLQTPLVSPWSHIAYLLWSVSVKKNRAIGNMTKRHACWFKRNSSLSTRSPSCSKISQKTTTQGFGRGMRGMVRGAIFCTSFPDRWNHAENKCTTGEANKKNYSQFSLFIQLLKWGHAPRTYHLHWYFVKCNQIVEGITSSDLHKHIKTLLNNRNFLNLVA